jgi:hypothetical protein
MAERHVKILHLLHVKAIAGNIQVNQALKFTATIPAKADGIGAGIPG